MFQSSTSLGNYHKTVSSILPEQPYLLTYLLVTHADADAAKPPCRRHKLDCTIRYDKIRYDIISCHIISYHVVYLTMCLTWNQTENLKKKITNKDEQLRGFQKVGRILLLIFSTSIGHDHGRENRRVAFLFVWPCAFSSFVELQNVTVSRYSP